MMSRSPSVTGGGASAQKTTDEAANVSKTIVINRRDTREVVLEKAGHHSPAQGDARRSRDDKWSLQRQNWNGRRNQGGNNAFGQPGGENAIVPQGVEAKIRILRNESDRKQLQQTLTVNNGGGGSVGEFGSVAAGVPPRSMSALAMLGQEKKPTLAESRGEAEGNVVVRKNRPKSTTPGLVDYSSLGSTSAANPTTTTTSNKATEQISGGGSRSSTSMHLRHHDANKISGTKIRRPVATLNHDGAPTTQPPVPTTASDPLLRASSYPSTVDNNSGAAVGAVGSGSAASGGGSRSNRPMDIITHLESIGYSLQKMFLAALSTSASMYGYGGGRPKLVQTKEQKERELRRHAEAFAIENRFDPGRLHRWIDLDATSETLNAEAKHSVFQLANRVRGRSTKEQLDDDDCQHAMLAVVSAYVSGVLLQRRLPPASPRSVGDTPAIANQKQMERLEEAQRRNKTATGHEAQVTSSLLQSLHTTTSNQELHIGIKRKKKEDLTPASSGAGSEEGSTAMKADVLRAQFRHQVAYDGLSLVDFCEIFSLSIDKLRLWLHQGDQGRSTVERTATSFLEQSSNLRQTFLEELNRNDLTASEFCSNTQATPGDLASWLSGSKQYHRPTVRAVWFFVHNSVKEFTRLNRPRVEMLRLVTLPASISGGRDAGGKIYERRELLPKMQNPAAVMKHKMKSDAYSLEKVIAHRRGCAERVGDGATQSSMSLLNILKDAHNHRSVVADKLLIDESEAHQARELAVRAKPKHASWALQKHQAATAAATPSPEWAEHYRRQEQAEEHVSGGEHHQDSSSYDSYSRSPSPNNNTESMKRTKSHNNNGIPTAYAVGQRLEKKIKSERRAEAEAVRRLLLREATKQQVQESKNDILFNDTTS